MDCRRGVCLLRKVFWLTVPTVHVCVCLTFLFLGTNLQAGLSELWCKTFSLQGCSSVSELEHGPCGQRQGVKELTEKEIRQRKESGPFSYRTGVETREECSLLRCHAISSALLLSCQRHHKTQQTWWQYSLSSLQFVYILENNLWLMDSLICNELWPCNLGQPSVVLVLRFVDRVM